MAAAGSNPTCLKVTREIGRKAQGVGDSLDVRLYGYEIGKIEYEREPSDGCGWSVNKSQ